MPEHRVLASKIEFFAFQIEFFAFQIEFFAFEIKFLQLESPVFAFLAVSRSKMSFFGLIL